MSDLARKLVEHKRWEYRAGMCIGGHHLGRADVSHLQETGGYSHADVYGRPVDLADPATQGILLAVLREAAPESHGVALAHSSVGRVDAHWYAYALSPTNVWSVYGQSHCPGEALAKAILWAWRRWTAEEAAR